MADNIPIEDVTVPPASRRGAPKSFLGRADDTLNSFFGPINRRLESVMGRPDPVQTLMMSLNAMRPGGMMPRGGSMPFFMQQPRGPGAPQVPPGSQTPGIGGLRPGITERGNPSTGVWPSEPFPSVVPETPAATNIPLATGQPQVNSIPRGPQMDPRFGGSTPIATKEQPTSPPSINDLILRMLQQRANPMGVLESTRRDAGVNVGRSLRPQTFDPNAERLGRYSDAIMGRRVLTPANRTADQSFNLSVIRQLLGE